MEKSDLRRIPQNLLDNKGKISGIIIDIGEKGSVDLKFLASFKSIITYSMDINSLTTSQGKNISTTWGLNIS